MEVIATGCYGSQECKGSSKRDYTNQWKRDPAEVIKYDILAATSDLGSLHTDVQSEEEANKGMILCASSLAKHLL